MNTAKEQAQIYRKVRALIAEMNDELDFAKLEVNEVDWATVAENGTKIQRLAAEARALSEEERNGS